MNDPNEDYLASLPDDRRQSYLFANAACGNEANQRETANLQRAAEAVDVYMKSATDQLKATEVYQRALAVWADCIKDGAGFEVAEREDIRKYVNATIIPQAERLANANDTKGLEQLKQREVEQATAASQCEAARQRDVESMQKQLEIRMIQDHLTEFTAYLAALEGN